MAYRNENPLGIRKLDVQFERRTVERVTANAWAERTTDYWFGQHSNLSAEDLVQVKRLVATAYSVGWNEGVKLGATKTRDRVAEALEQGKLVKPIETVSTELTAGR